MEQGSWSRPYEKDLSLYWVTLGQSGLKQSERAIKSNESAGSWLRNGTSSLLAEKHPF